MSSRPDVKPAAGAAGDGAEARNSTAKNTAGAHRWQIEIVNPIDGRPKVWDRYDSRDCAESVAGTLRHHGFWCQVRRVEDDPEHRGDRRRFLVWAIMAGFAQPERMTERILAEIEHEATR